MVILIADVDVVLDRQSAGFELSPPPGLTVFSRKQVQYYDQCLPPQTRHTHTRTHTRKGEVILQKNLLTLQSWRFQKHVYMQDH